MADRRRPAQDTASAPWRVEQIPQVRWVCARKRCGQVLGWEDIEGYDSDNLGIASLLSPDERRPDGFYGAYWRGQCRGCRAELTAGMVSLVDADVGEISPFRDHWLWRNGDMGVPRNFIVRYGRMAWALERSASPLGAVDHHVLGPYIFREGQAWRDALRYKIRSLWELLRTINRTEF